MATDTSNIDDLLMGSATATQPQTPEYQPELEASAEEPALQEESYEEPEERQEKEAKPLEVEETDTDDYGNKKSQDNEVIRERLRKQAESMKRQHQLELDALRAQMNANTPMSAPQGVTEGFKYDEGSNQTWDQQLRQFVEQTVNTMSQRQQQEIQRQQDARSQAEFESKFRDDVQKFSDFEEVISSVAAPISDPMIYATRGMKNPASFLYAASKRMPQELQRISKIQDPYIQIAEMGRLEATLRQTKPSTKAPKPVGRTAEDTGIPYKNDKEMSIEEKIMLADRRRLNVIKQRGSLRR